MTAGEVALCARGAIVGQGEDIGIGRTGAAPSGCGTPSGRGRHPILSAAVEGRTDAHRPIDVAVHETDQNFLTDARDEAGAGIRPGMASHHAYPA